MNLASENNIFKGKSQNQDDGQCPQEIFAGKSCFLNLNFLIDLRSTAIVKIEIL